LAIAHYRAALELVEGEPLANALSGYSWWEAEGHGGRIAAVLVDAACSMATLAAEAGHFELAHWGLERARLLEPYSETLSRAAMQLAAAEGDADRLRLEWRECQRRVDALDPGSTPSLRTESLYGELSRRILVDSGRPLAEPARYAPASSD
jgi:DNA-binding SARP family transcriptional activator